MSLRGRSASLVRTLKVSLSDILPQTICYRRCVVDGSNQAGMFLELRGLRLEFQPQTSSATGATREQRGLTMQLVLATNNRRVWARFRCITAFGCLPLQQEAIGKEEEGVEEGSKVSAPHRRPATHLRSAGRDASSPARLVSPGRRVAPRWAPVGSCPAAAAGKLQKAPRRNWSSCLSWKEVEKSLVAEALGRFVQLY